MPFFPSSGVSIDNETIGTNAAGELNVKQSVITQTTSYSNITYSANTTLTGDVYANNLTIDSGVTVTTAGYNFYCKGIFTNNGTITSSGYGSSGENGNGISLPNSYGGSGGGGGQDAGGGTGGNTLVAGGAPNSLVGSAGATPTPPTLTASLIQSWITNGISNYLSGAGGGGGNNGTGQNGGGGIYVQANQIIAGTINANGIQGNGTNGGAGGGGCILLVYGSGGYTAGTYNVNGGAQGINYGGAGGAGNLMTFQDTSQVLPSFAYTTNTTSIQNRNASYLYDSSQTTSTTPVTIITQSITPQTTGLVYVRVVAKISNNTIGDGIQIGLFNGSTPIDFDEYTQEGISSNPHLTELYYEAQYSTGTAQAFSIQYNAITGGIASCEIQEFTIAEVY
jgi:hypothetical protein